MVQRTGGEGRLGRTVCRAWLHGYQTLWLCHLGEDAAPARPDVQGDWRAERLLPPAHSEVIPLA